MARGVDRGWTATNVVTLEVDHGVKVHAFDVRCWADVAVVDRDGLKPDVPKTVRKHQGATYSAAVARLSVNAPRLVIVRENFVSKLFAVATRIDLDVKSESFNRWYHVISADRAFAYGMLDARMIDLMTQTEGKISFEFSGDWLLLHTAQLEPELLPGLARLAARMSRVVRQSGFTAIPR